MTSSNPFSFDSFVVGIKDELAIFIEDSGKEQIINLKDPKVTNITVEEKRDFTVEHTMAGEPLHMPQGQHIEATITIETIKWESIWGEDIRDELPDVVDEMSVEQLLHAVNKKIEGEEK